MTRYCGALGVLTLAILMLAVVHTGQSAARPHLLPSASPQPPATAAPDVLVEQARLLNNADRPAAAQQALNDALQDVTIDQISLFRAYFLRAQVFQQQGNLEQALSDYTDAITAQPDIAEVYAFRATIYFSLEDYENALIDYTTAIEFDGSQASYYLARGIVYTLLEDYDTAIADFSAALSFDDSLVTAYRERGLAALANNDPTQAQNDLLTYLEQSPEATDREQIEEILEDLP